MIKRKKYKKIHKNLYHGCFLTLQIFSPILFYVNSFTNNELCILFVRDQISISLVHPVQNVLEL